MCYMYSGRWGVAPSWETSANNKPYITPNRHILRMPATPLLSHTSSGNSLPYRGVLQGTTDTLVFGRWRMKTPMVGAGGLGYRVNASAEWSSSGPRRVVADKAPETNHLCPFGD